MNPLGVPMTSDEYADQWRAESHALNARGDYGWMAAEAGQELTVLEVGCGVGHGTAALIGRGSAVVVIEQNERLAALALDHLSRMGIPIVRIDKGDAIERPRPGTVAFLAESIFEPSLVERLPPLDVIACWLIGAEPRVIGDALGRDLDDITGSDLTTYRWAVHSQCYDIGRKVLIHSGMVHLVDRCLIAGWNSKDARRMEHAEEHRARAGDGFAFSAKNVFLRRIPGDFNASAIRYVFDRAPVDQVLTPVLASLRAIRT